MSNTNARNSSSVLLFTFPFSLASSYHSFFSVIFASSTHCFQYPQTSSTPFQTSTSQVFPSMDEESLDEYYDDGTPWVLFTSEIVSPSSSTTSSPAGTPFTCRGEERNAARGRYWGVGGYFVVPTEPIVGAWTVVEWVVGAKWRENDKCVKGEENGGGLL